MEYGPGDAERYQRRLKNQRRYQRTHRNVQAEEGVPERDDVAKVVLHTMLDGFANRPETIDMFVEQMAERLTQERKHFDKERSAGVLRSMIERHLEAMKREARRRRAAGWERGA